MNRTTLTFLAALAAIACAERDDAPGAEQTAAAPAPTPDFAGEVWLRTDADAPPGAMMIFTQNGVLVQDSCWETYRLSRWRKTPEGRVVWDEDGADIEASVLDLTEETMTLRLHLRSEEKTQTYRAAGTPYVCPDMPR
ncbi:MAG: hypothetical protein Kow00133_07290 [Amphiplicatus sp.]